MTRADLPPGAQAVQSIHAALGFTLRYPAPETLALLAARDEAVLRYLHSSAHRAGLHHFTFREPDLGNALTSVALGPEAQRLCRKFPLALRREVNDMAPKHQIEPEIDWRALAGELGDDKLALEAQLAGNIPSATLWLQGKVRRQGAALDALNRKVVTQRFVLRELERRGRGLTREEYLQARKEVENEQLRDRIEDLEAE